MSSESVISNEELVKYIKQLISICQEAEELINNIEKLMVAGILISAIIGSAEPRTTFERVMKKVITAKMKLKETQGILEYTLRHYEKTQ